MKYITSILLSALLAYAVGIYGNLPWWSFVVTNFIIAFSIPIKPAHSFTAGALGVGSLWAGLAFGIDLSNNHILSTKVAKILPLGGSYVVLIFITFLIGALLGGLASLTGSFLRNNK
ncbi:MAG: hypothetical protein EB092_04220 [Chitinophagia bacterium]|jgi:hypothetical protein|nr:hypothetical protein [Chitinophagia bacterium]NCA30170.1 hypothetical protein [Chitinophagia bacterium]NDD16196.1 hypothetical protein [Chitinophagia bacterium]